MPAQNLQIAVSSLLVPRMSRLAGAGDAAGISRLLRGALGLTALCGVVPVALSPLAGPLLKTSEYAAVGTIAFPVAIQAAIYLIQVPFTAALRGMQRVRSLFVQYVVFAVASAAGLVLGTLAFNLRGAAWGMTAGAFIGLVTMIALYRKAHASLGPPDQVVGQPQPDGVAGPTPVR